MAKNLIPTVCKLLDVEVGEEFKIKGYDTIYTIDAKGIIKYSYQDYWVNSHIELIDLLSGELEIIKLPWKPRGGKMYCSFNIYSDEKLHTCEYYWHGDVMDFALFKVGWVYRTYEEAEAALPKVAEEMGVDYEL